MSRTAFAMRFRELVGESPLRYATRCRMNHAAALLGSTDSPIARIAERVGADFVAKLPEKEAAKPKVARTRR